MEGEARNVTLMDEDGGGGGGGGGVESSSAVVSILSLQLPRYVVH